MRVLHGRGLATAIKDMLDGEDGVRCAVAFWGPAIAARARRRGATVVLDLSMRGTTRNALTALGVRRKGMTAAVGDRVRVLDRLHAKIYLGRDTAIIGSANASLNALGRDGGEPALREAGVAIDRIADPDGFADAERLWRRFLKASRAVTPKDLDRAPHVAATPAARDVDERASDPSTSILDAALRRPDDFTSTVLVFGDHDISTEDESVVAGDYEEEQGETPRRHGRALICTFWDGVAPDRDLLTALRVVMFWFGKKPGIYAYDEIVQVEQEGRRSFFGRRRWPTVGRTLGLGGVTATAAWDADRERAVRMAAMERQAVGKRFVVLSSPAAASWVERHPGK